MEHKLKKIKLLLSLSALLFLTVGILLGSRFTKNKQNITGNAAGATTLSISPSNQTAYQNSNVNFSVQMSTGQNQVTGFDLVLKFDPEVIHVNSVLAGSGLGNLNNVINNDIDNLQGKITYTTFTLDKNLALNGDSLEILKINASINQNAVPGSYLLSFDSLSAISATHESQNVLTSTAPGTINVIASTPAPTQAPTSEPAVPNSCNGTCGSNANCQSNLFCYQGYCRNPDCSNSMNCECPTISPTPTPTTSSRRTASPRPTATPRPTIHPLSSQTPELNTTSPFWESVYTSEPPTASPFDNLNFNKDQSISAKTNLLPWIIGSLGLAGIAILFIVWGIYRHTDDSKPKTPVIKL